MPPTALLIVLLLTVFFSPIADAAADDAANSFRQTTLFRAGEGGYNNYRIPAAIRTTRNTILAFCEGRQAQSDAGEINLLLRRSTDGGATFDAPRVVWADGKNTCGNPCPVVDESTGTIHLLMTHNLGEDREREITLGTAKGTRTVWITDSTDDGVTWSPPREITASVKKPNWAWYATGPGIGIQVKHGPRAGRLVVPCDYAAIGGAGDQSNAFVIYSDDHGQTWHIGGEPPQHNFNESQVVELTGGRLMLNLRNVARPSSGPPLADRGVSISDDAGNTFAPATWDASLPEPRCQASILRFSWPEGDARSVLLFSNPATTGKARTTMTVRASYDEGKTWPMKKVVFKDFAAYSCLVALPDHTVGLLYEAGDKKGYERIDFARFTLDWLTDGKPTP